MDEGLWKSSRRMMSCCVSQLLGLFSSSNVGESGRFFESGVPGGIYVSFSMSVT
jgi:hypothetical protein